MPAPAAGSSAHGKVEAFPPRAADVVEVACIGARGDELDVVAIEGAKHIRTPVQAAIRQIPAQPYLECVRHHLLQTRVAREIVRQPAGLLRVCTPQLQDARCATRLVVVGVVRHHLGRRDREADRRIDSTEGVLADERAGLIKA